MKKILILIGILVLGPNFLASAESQGDEVATLVTTTVETTTFGPDGTAKRTEKQHHRQIVPHKNGENLPEDKLVELAKKADKTKIHVEKKAETLGIWDTATKVVKGQIGRAHV